MPLTGDNPLLKLQKLSRVLQLLPKQMQAEAVNFFKDNFDKQGFQGDNGLDPWKPNKSKKADGDKILVNRAFLKNGIQVIAVRPNSFTIGVTGVAAAYADIHNTGGTTHPKVTPKLRKYAWAMFYKTKDPKWKAIALTKKSTLTVVIPQRKFIGPSKQLKTKLEKLIQKKINEALK